MVAPVQATAPPVGGVPVPVPPALVLPAPAGIGSRGARTPGSDRASAPPIGPAHGRLIGLAHGRLIGLARARPSGPGGDLETDPVNGAVAANGAGSVGIAPSGLPPVLSGWIAQSGGPASAVVSAPLRGIASPDLLGPAAPSASAGPIDSGPRIASAGAIAFPPPPESAAPTAASRASPSPASPAAPSGKAHRPIPVEASAQARPSSPMLAALSRAAKPRATPPMSPPI